MLRIEIFAFKKLPTRINILPPQKNTDLLLVKKFIQVRNCSLQDHHLISNDCQFSAFHFGRIRAFFGFQPLHSRERSRRPHPSLVPRKKLNGPASDLDRCTMAVCWLVAGSSFQKVICLLDPPKNTCFLRHQKNYRSCFCKPKMKNTFFWWTTKKIHFNGWGMRFCTQITRCFLNPSVDLLQPKNRQNDPCLAFGTARHLG